MNLFFLLALTHSLTHGFNVVFYLHLQLNHKALHRKVYDIKSNCLFGVMSSFPFTIFRYKNNNTLENELELKEGEYGIYQTITYFLGSVLAQSSNTTNSNTRPVKWVMIEGSMYGNRRF